MSETERPIDKSLLGGGIALVLAGLALTLVKLDLIRIDGLWRFAPLFVVGAGIWRLATASEPNHRRDGTWIALVGLWLLVNTLELFGLFWHNSWPLMMILVGLLHLVWPKDKDERVGGVVLIAVGTWLLLTVTHTFGLDWRTAWPMLLVIAGVACVVKALMRALPALMGGRS